MDIATFWDPAAGQGDWALAPTGVGVIVDQDGVAITDEGGQVLTDGLLTFSGQPGLLAGRDLATAVLISLFTDATAEADDAIPDGTGDPRGWWAGAIGSKLWLRMRAKRTPTLAALIKADIEAALVWLVEDKVATAVDVAVDWRSPGQCGATIAISRADGSTASLRFAWAWETL